MPQQSRRWTPEHQGADGISAPEPARETDARSHDTKHKFNLDF
jgi:hypothetical protein